MSGSRLFFLTLDVPDSSFQFVHASDESRWSYQQLRSAIQLHGQSSGPSGWEKSGWYHTGACIKMQPSDCTARMHRYAKHKLLVSHAVMLIEVARRQQYWAQMHQLRIVSCASVMRHL